MTSQTITIQVLLNIAQTKCNQAVKFGLVIECSKINLFLQTFHTSFLFFRKALYKLKASSWNLGFNNFNSSQLGIQ